jgi:Leucine-rich repeat (LRR) protein
MHKTETCKLLAMAKLSQLRQLFLDDNQIGNEGCQHLSKSSWPNLTQLNLSNK